MERRASGSEEKDWRKKNLRSFTAAALVYSFILLAGLVASPPERRFRAVAGALSCALLAESTITIFLVLTDPKWMNPVSKLFFQIHVTSSLLLLLAISSFLCLGIFLDNLA